MDSINSTAQCKLTPSHSGPGPCVVNPIYGPDCSVVKIVVSDVHLSSVKTRGTLMTHIMNSGVNIYEKVSYSMHYNCLCKDG